MSQNTINPTSKDFLDEFDETHSDTSVQEVVEPLAATTKTQPKTKSKKECDTMNQTNQPTTNSLTPKQFKLLDFYAKECLRYLELEETQSATPSKRGRGSAPQVPEKTGVDLILAQLKKVSEALREDYIQGLEE